MLRRFRRRVVLFARSLLLCCSHHRRKTSFDPRTMVSYAPTSLSLPLSRSLPSLYFLSLLAREYNTRTQFHVLHAARRRRSRYDTTTSSSLGRVVLGQREFALAPGCATAARTICCPLCIPEFHSNADNDTNRVSRSIRRNVYTYRGIFPTDLTTRSLPATKWRVIFRVL